MKKFYIIFFLQLAIALSSTMYYMSPSAEIWLGNDGSIILLIVNPISLAFLALSFIVFIYYAFSTHNQRILFIELFIFLIAAVGIFKSIL